MNERNYLNYQSVFDKGKNKKSVYNGYKNNGKHSYTRLHKNQIQYYISAAAVLTGIAAVFVSTKISEFTFISIFFYSVFVLTHMVSFCKPCAFLFVQMTDKPSLHLCLAICFGFSITTQPRCRSPPRLLSF